MTKTLTHSKLGPDNPYTTLRNKNEFVDVQLCSYSNKDKLFSVHKLVLGAVSKIWKKKLLKLTNIHEPFVIERINHHVLEQILDFIYNGKIEIPEDEFDDFTGACRMINLRLGSPCDKIIYQEEDVPEDEKSPSKMETIIKKETDMLPTTACFPFVIPTNGFIPSTSEDSLLRACLKGLKTSKKLKLEPQETRGFPEIQQELVHPPPFLNNPQITNQEMLQNPSFNELPMTNLMHQQEHLNNLEEIPDIKPNIKRLHQDDTEPQSATEQVVKRPKLTLDQLAAAYEKNLDKAPETWIIIRGVESEKQITDTCKRFGMVDFHTFPLQNEVYVSFRTMKGAIDSLGILKLSAFVCGFGSPPDLGSIQPPAAICRPPPAMPLPSLLHGVDSLGMAKQIEQSPPPSMPFPSMLQAGDSSGMGKQMEQPQPQPLISTLPPSLPFTTQLPNFQVPPPPPPFVTAKLPYHQDQRSDLKANGRPEVPKKNVYVGNLEMKTTTEELASFLGSQLVSYELNTLRVIARQDKTFAFLNCGSIAEKDHFINVMNGVEFKERKMVVGNAKEGKISDAIQKIVEGTRKQGLGRPPLELPVRQEWDGSQRWEEERAFPRKHGQERGFKGRNSSDRNWNDRA